MNLVALAAAVVLFSQASHDSRVSASIDYTTVDRDGNVLSVSVSSNDPYYYPYYGRETFYYRDRYYYRHYSPRTVVFHPRPVYVYSEPIIVCEPVYVVRDKHFKKPKPAYVYREPIYVSTRPVYVRDDKDWRDRDERDWQYRDSRDWQSRDDRDWNARDRVVVREERRPRNEVVIHARIDDRSRERASYSKGPDHGAKGKGHSSGGGKGNKGKSHKH